MKSVKNTVFPSVLILQTINNNNINTTRPFCACICLLSTIIDRLPFCNTQPLRCRFSIFVKNFFLIFLFFNTESLVRLFFIY